MEEKPKITIEETYRKEDDGVVYRFWRIVGTEIWHKEETSLKDPLYTTLKDKTAD